MRRVAASCTAVLAAVSMMLVLRAAQAAQRPTGVIVGIVTDASGAPVVGARVQAVVRRKRWAAGPLYETPVGVADDSDDRGRFRLHSLAPGSYVVAVSIEEKPPLSVESGYMRTYNPGTTFLADAEPIDVRGEVEQSTSIRFAPTPFVFVYGVAMTSDGQPAANFDVWLRGGPATISYTVQGFRTNVVARARVAPDGAFTLARVPAGVYTLVVTNGPARQGRPLEIAERPLEVRNTTINDIRINTARGATVSGRLEWAGTGPAPWPRDSLGTLRAMSVGREDEADYATQDSNIRPDGTFEFTNLYGLRRIVALSLQIKGGIRSVEGPAGVVVGRNIDVKPGATITDLRITITDRTGTLLATASDEDNKPFSGWLLLMPRGDPDALDSSGWAIGAIQINHVERDVGYYWTRPLVAGSSYLVVAVDVEPSRLFGDADLMERARVAAMPVEIREGETRLNVKAVRLRPYVLPGP